MGILKYYSPYSTNSIEITIHLENEKPLFPNESFETIKQNLNKFTFNLNKNGRTLKKDENFENFDNPNYPSGDYILTLFYKGLLKDMNNLFEDCSSFTKIDLSNFNTYKVKQMNETFKNCSNLTEIKFSNYKTNGVEEMENTFSDCHNLQKINLLNFKGSKLIRYQNMFSGINNNLRCEASENIIPANRNETLVYTKEVKIIQLTNQSMSSQGSNENTQASNDNMNRRQNEYFGRAIIQGVPNNNNNNNEVNLLHPNEIIIQRRNIEENVFC